MKSVLFRILVLVLGGIVLLAQTDSLAARGGRGGGGAEEAEEPRRRWRTFNQPRGRNGRRRRALSQQPAFGVGRRLSRWHELSRRRGPS